MAAPTDQFAVTYVGSPADLDLRDRALAILGQSRSCPVCRRPWAEHDDHVDCPTDDEAKPMTPERQLIADFAASDPCEHDDDTRAHWLTGTPPDAPQG